MSIAAPLFVVGCMRSGTTVIRKMLSQYFPRATDLGDGDFEGRMFWQQRGFNIGSPKTGTHCDAYDGTTVTDAQKREMREYVRSRETGDRHLINKNPHLCNKVGLLNAVFPEARIVHLVRQQPAVVASTKLHMLSAYEGETFYGNGFVHFWPDNGETSCWSCLPNNTGKRGRVPIKRQIRRMLIGWRGHRPKHMSAEDFHRQQPDLSRYYPGAGFRRIPESWLRLNANLIRQIDSADMQDRYMTVNYADLVTHTRDTLARIAAFAGVDHTAPDAVPVSLDTARQERWRKDLTQDEQRCIAEVNEELAADAHLIRERLTGPLFAS